MLAELKFGNGRYTDRMAVRCVERGHTLYGKVVFRGWTGMLWDARAKMVVNRDGSKAVLKWVGEWLGHCGSNVSESNNLNLARWKLLLGYREEEGVDAKLVGMLGRGGKLDRMGMKFMFPKLSREYGTKDVLRNNVEERMWNAVGNLGGNEDTIQINILPDQRPIVEGSLVYQVPVLIVNQGTLGTVNPQIVRS